MKTKDFDTEALEEYAENIIIGLPILAIMMWVRGVIKVLGIEISKGASFAISGIAGIGHIMVGLGIIFLFLALKNSARA